MRREKTWDQPKHRHDWDDRPPPEPKPRRPLRHLPWALALGLVAGVAIERSAQSSDRSDYDRLMAGVGSPAQESLPSSNG